MMTDAEKRLIIDLELLYDKWSREWLERIHNDTQLSREDERVRLLELKKIITDHSGINANMEGYLK